MKTGEWHNTRLRFKKAGNFSVVVVLHVTKLNAIWIPPSLTEN